MSGSPATIRNGSGAHAPVLIALLLICLNLRVVFGGVGPLLPYMHLTPIMAGALTAFPPLCMGLFAPLGAIASSRWGEERALFLAMFVLVAGIVVRSTGLPGLLIGTVVASAGIAGLNVLTPLFIRRQFAPERMGVMMGLYAMMMGAGGGIMAALAVPLYEAMGGSWPLALAAAAIPAVFALIALLPLLGGSRRHAGMRPDQRWHALLRHRIAWSIIGFFGIQCLLFYTLLAWLPAIAIARGATPAMAGLGLALCIFAAGAGGFFGPTLAAGRADQRFAILASIVLCIIGLLGVLLAPTVTMPFWIVLLGTGTGAGQGIPSVLYARRTVSHPQMAQLSGMVQMIGYPIAATGPVIAAMLHDWSGGWGWPIAFLVVLLVVNAFVSRHGGRDHKIEG